MAFINPVPQVQQLAQGAARPQSPFVDLTIGSPSSADAAQLPASGVPFWGDHPSTWDKVVIAGITLPGLARVTGELEQVIDKKKKPGRDGAKLSLLGWEPTKVEILLELWTGDQLAALESFLRIIRAKVTPAPPSAATSASYRDAAVDIYYPSLELMQIRSVLIYSVGLLQRGDQDTYTLKLKALEFRDDPARVTTPKTSADNWSKQGDALSARANQGQVAAGDVPPPSTNNVGPP